MRWIVLLTLMLAACDSHFDFNDLSARVDLGAHDLTPPNFDAAQD